MNESQNALANMPFTTPNLKPQWWNLTYQQYEKYIRL
jgi:hypothetical protein